MNFNQFVFRNTIRNKHLYLAYFLSAATSVTVFFSFMALASHPSVVQNMNQNTSNGVSFAAWIMYGFAFLFVLYSMGNFVQSRKREFGTLMIQGLSPSQLRRMVISENLILGFFATVTGCILGLGFTQVLIGVGNHFLKLGYAHYLPLNTIEITVKSFMLLFAIISLLIWWRLPRMSLQELLKAGKLGSKPIRFSIVLSVLGIAMMATGYWLLLEMPPETLMVMAGPVGIMETIASLLIFHQASVMIIQVLKWIKPIFWRKTNLTILSDLAFRMKENARAFFLVSVISSVAFVTIGSLIGFQNQMVDMIKEDPYELRVYGTGTEAKSAINEVNQKLAENNIDAQRGDALYYTNEDESYGVIRESDFNRLEEVAGLETVKTNGDAILVQAKKTSNSQFTPKPSQELTVDGKKLKANKIVISKVLPGSTHYVVPDDTDLSQYEEITYSIWMTKSADKELLAKIGVELIQSNSAILSKEGQISGILVMFGPIVFIGSFISVIFFLSAGSFIYFRLYSDLNPDIQKFKMLYKIGLSKKEMNRIISKQLAIVFFTPITLALVNGYFGLVAMYRIFDSTLDMMAWGILGGFLLVQVIYYLIARHFYFKKVYQTVAV